MPKASGKKRWKRENPGQRFTLLGLLHQTESGWDSGTHRKEKIWVKMLGNAEISNVPNGLGLGRDCSSSAVKAVLEETA